MASELLTTGQAAKLCAVTRDTVLKWIHSGQIPAQRTAGGHHRIRREDIEAARSTFRERSARLQQTFLNRNFEYCWEYQGRGSLSEECSRCSVYLSRAQRCYELAKLGLEGGHSGQFCHETCSDCDYYSKVVGQAVNVLVVTNDEVLTDELVKSAGEADFNLEVVNCEYDCATLLNRFSPDYIVVDCQVGSDFAVHIAGHLNRDPRVPVLRLILGGDEGVFPEDCADGILARIRRPFNVKGISECVASLREHAGEVSVS